MDGEACQKGLDLCFGTGQILPAARMMKFNVAFNPVEVTAFGMDRAMVHPHHIAYLVQQHGGLRLTFHGHLLRFYGEFSLCM